MTVNIIHNGNTLPVELERLVTYARQVVWVGAPSDEVYNTITLPGVDTFQCSIAYDKTAGMWLLTDGQVRTHCSRGLKSDRSRACSMCKGCCGYIRTANPHYSLRQPSLPTLLNGHPLSEEGSLLTEGDTITFNP